MLNTILKHLEFQLTFVVETPFRITARRNYLTQVRHFYIFQWANQKNEFEKIIKAYSVAKTCVQLPIHHYLLPSGKIYSFRKMYIHLFYYIDFVFDIDMLKFN